MSDALTDAQMLSIWERGIALGPTERALLMVGVAAGESDAASLRRLPLGRRDARLLEIHETTFGDAVRCCATCPRCRMDLEFDLSTRTLRTRSGGLTEAFNVEAGGNLFEVRMPTSDDALAVERLASPAEAERALWQRCVTAWDRERQPIAWERIDAAQRAAVESALEEADPQLDLSFALRCADCGYLWTTPCEFGRILWLQIERSARNLLAQVDALARTYGWSEDEILGLGQPRRDLYLSMLE